MSQTKRRYQAGRWLQTAEEDLKAAGLLVDTEMYAHTCFLAQQSGEKAVKSLWHLIDADPCGNSVQRFIAEFPPPEEIPDRNAWIEHGAWLDKFYTPTRYPNGLPDLTPGQVNRREDAERGLYAARSLLAGCREWLAER